MLVAPRARPRSSAATPGWRSSSASSTPALAVARRGGAPSARPAARPRRERLPPPRRARSRWPSACVALRAREAPRDAGRRGRRRARASSAASRCSSAGCRKSVVRAGIASSSWSGRCSGVAYAMWALWHDGARAGRPRAARRRSAVVTGPRHVARLPPPAHPPQLPDRRRGSRRPRCRRRDGRAEPADRLGGAPPRAPRPRRPRGRPAQPRSTASCTRTSAGSSPSAPPSASATAGRLLDDPVVMLIDRTALVWLALGLVLPALDRRLARPALGRHRAHRRPQPGDVRGELGLPRVRLAAVRDRRREPQQPGSWPRSRSARAGTTTTTPSRRWRTTAWAATPMRPASSSAGSSGSGWPGTCAGRARRRSSGGGPTTRRRRGDSFLVDPSQGGWRWLSRRDL